jgi:hypothetical protein
VFRLPPDAAAHSLTLAMALTCLDAFMVRHSHERRGWRLLIATGDEPKLLASIARQEGLTKFMCSELLKSANPIEPRIRTACVF